MLEPMKRHPIEITFQGPYGNRQKAIRALSKLGFVEKTDSVPWREAFSDISDEELPGACLKGARVKEGVTQKQLAEMTSVRQNHISEMENAKRTIGKKNAVRFGKALNINYKIFL